MTNNSEIPMKIADSSVVDLSYYKEVKSYSDFFWNCSLKVVATGFLGALLLSHLLRKSPWSFTISDGLRTGW